MATKTVKSRPGGPKTTVTRRPPKARTAAPTAAPSTTATAGAQEAEDAEKPAGSFLKNTLLPSAACGVLLALVAYQEGADLAVAAVMAVCMTGVIAGMVRLKKAFTGG